MSENQPPKISQVPGKEPLPPAEIIEPGQRAVTAQPGEPMHDVLTDRFAAVMTPQAEPTAAAQPEVTPDPVTATNNQIEAAAVRPEDLTNPNKVQTEQQMNLDAASRQNAADAGTVPTADLR